jgi:lipoate-protein ligase B
MSPATATRAPQRSLAVHRLGLVGYDEALEEQRHREQACKMDGAAHLLLLAHPPTYTLGARARAEHLLVDESRLLELGATVRRVDRGGDITFHGPGQLVGYPIVDLRRWGQGPVWYVRSLEETVIRTLARFDIEGERRNGTPGVWVGEEKIAAIGVRISRGITSHGFALNVDPDLDYFKHIVPCGLPEAGVTSMSLLLGRGPSMELVMEAVEDSFRNTFGFAAGPRVPAGVL